MEGFVAICVVFLVIFLLYKFARIAGSSIPSVDSDELKYFISSTRNDYGYHYYLDGTGFALSVERAKICLIKGSLDKKSHYKIYDLSQIRKIYWEWDGYQYWHESSLHPGTMLNNSIRKRDAKYDAYKNSGIFIKVSDIDNPSWQIRFADLSALEKNFEILQQFMEGVLPVPNKVKSQD